MADYRYNDKDAEKIGDNGLHPTTTYGEGTARRASISDAVFGEITEDGPNYRAVRVVASITTESIFTNNE